MITSINDIYKISPVEENHSIISKNEVVNVIESREVVNLTVTSEGDMTKSIYDTDNNHIVDNASNALKLGGTPANSFLKETDIIDCGTF